MAVLYHWRWFNCGDFDIFMIVMMLVVIFLVAKEIGSNHQLATVCKDG